LPAQPLRVALRIIAFSGAIVSVIGLCAVFAFPHIVGPFASPLGYAGVAALVLSLWLSKSFPRPSEMPPRWKRVVYRLVGYTYLAMCLLYLLTAPEAGASLQHPAHAYPLALWTLPAGTYESMRIFWLYVTGLFSFAISIAAFDPPSPDRIDTGEPPRRLALLSKPGLFLIIAPPVALYLVGRLLLVLKLTSQDMAFAIMAIGGLWFIPAMLVLGIALIVSGASSNPKPDQPER